MPSYSNFTFLLPPSNCSKISAFSKTLGLSPFSNKPSPKITLVPGFNFLPGFTITSHISPSIRCNNKNSTCAPVSSFTPYKRAGITFVLFLTKQSPGSK